MPKLSNSTRTRAGAAAVEFAVVLPFIVLLILGAVEAGRAVTVQHSLEEAARAGCRLYVVDDVTEQEARDAIAQSLEQSGIKKYSITFNPSSKAGVDTHLEPVSVTVSANYSDVSWLPVNFFSGKAISGQCTLPADMNVYGSATGNNSGNGNGSGNSGGDSGSGGPTDPPADDDDDRDDDDDDDDDNDDDRDRDDDDDRRDRGRRNRHGWRRN